MFDNVQNGEYNTWRRPHVWLANRITHQWKFRVGAFSKYCWLYIPSTILNITSFVQYNRPCLPVLFWGVVFRNRTGIIHFRLMKMIRSQYKTAKNQFYLLMMLIVNKTLLNLRSQNRTCKTGFARPILGPLIFASSYFQYTYTVFRFRLIFSIVS